MKVAYGAILLAGCRLYAMDPVIEAAYAFARVTHVRLGVDSAVALLDMQVFRDIVRFAVGERKEITFISDDEKALAVAVHSPERPSLDREFALGRSGIHPVRGRAARRRLAAMPYIPNRCVMCVPIASSQVSVAEITGIRPKTSVIAADIVRQVREFHITDGSIVPVNSDGVRKQAIPLN
jgi:hypothetical protein